MRLPSGYGSVTKLSGNRRKPYAVRKTTGWEIDKKTDTKKQKYVVIGYAKTKSEGLQMLAEYNKNPFDITASKITFKEIYEKWSAGKFPSISKSNVNGYKASYSVCVSLYNKVFKDIRLADLQNVVDSCGKNFPTLRKLKCLFSQMYDYAMKNDICSKDYSDYIDIAKYHDKNPNKLDREKFTKENIETFWTLADNKFYQIILILIYTGVRISELLDLQKSSVNIEEQYFDVVKSKTESGIRRIPIADKILPFVSEWYNSSDSKYLLHTDTGKKFTYVNYYDSYFHPLMENLGLKQTPHCTRHTFISMMAEAHIDQTVIKKIVGHKGAMSLTEKVYTHLDVQELIDAVNKI